MPGSLPVSDQRFLHRAIQLGRRGWGKVHPNPMVGCVLVKEGKVVAEGWHETFGGSHAEAIALDRAGDGADGSTAYVSLEPCNHTGKTPPCARALMDAGVVKVVYGARDPGKDSGGGARTLREGGMEVVGPCLTLEDGRRENPSFFWNQERGSTFVAVKLAQSLDGRIAEAQGKRTHITGSEALEETHRLRSGFDGILVGSNTVLVDDPLLTVRHRAAAGRQPWRVVLDTEARTPLGANLFKDLPEAPLVFFTAEDTPESAVARLERAGARVRRVPRDRTGVSTTAVLEECWKMGLRSLLCEGGGKLAAGLLKEGLAQRIYLFVAPFVLGEGGVPAFPGLDSRATWEPWNPTGPGKFYGRDVLLTFDRKPGCSQES